MGSVGKKDKEIFNPRVGQKKNSDSDNDQDSDEGPMDRHQQTSSKLIEQGSEWDRENQTTVPAERKT
jgi:hypothetical protein